MIRVIYSNERLWKFPHALWSVSLFLISTIYVWYFVLKCCFQELAVEPPIPLTATFLVLTFMDRLYPFFNGESFLSIRFVVDMLILVMVALAFYLPDENEVCFLGLVVVVYLGDILYLKQLLFDIVRRNYWVYKIYIVVKIMYWILVYGHIIGCIFYAVEMNLLESQAFGPFALNPLNYYQGQLLAYTPIYMFQDMNRYVYAMYYSFALISSIAFGDIIGKNYIQDIYVSLLIILSTIVLALVVEQMFLIFRRRKNRFFQLLNKIRFLAQRLKGYKQIPKNFRYEIINFLIQANWRYINEQPEQLATANQFKTKLIKQSSIFNSQLPIFYSKYVLHKLKLSRLPKGILVYSNFPQRQQLVSYLVTKGQFWIGYSTYNGRLAGGYVLNQKGMNFGIEQALAGTNHLYHLLTIRTVSSGIVLTISYKQIRQIIEELSEVDFPYDKPIEHFQNAKDRAIFNQDKYHCSICGTTDHTLLKCPKCHYVVSESKKLEVVNKTNLRGLCQRKNRVARKIRNIHLQTIQQKQDKSWRLMQIRRFQNMFNQIKSSGQTNEDSIEQWHEWTVYGQDIKEQQKQEVFEQQNSVYKVIQNKVT